MSISTKNNFDQDIAYKEWP